MTIEPIRPTTPEHRLALKSAVRRALKLAGGAASVQYATRVGDGDLSRYGSQDHAERHCPIDVAVDLCLEAGHPVILEAMAQICGYRLVRLEGEADRAQDAQATLLHVAVVAAETSDFVGALAGADADGERTRREQQAVDQKAEEAVAAIRRAQGGR